YLVELPNFLECAREAELHADRRFQAAFPPSQLATVSINFFTTRTDHADTASGVEPAALEIGSRGHPERGRCQPPQGAHMCDQDQFEKDRQEYEARGLVTRRQFGVMLGAGVAMMLPRVVNAVAVTDADVTVTTADGTADCYFVHPASGTAPGVLMWPDIFGLRPAFRQMGKRLAESGYAVLVVNPFYRVQKAPTAKAGAATPIQELMPLAQKLNETTHTTDAKAFIAWLDQQSSV